MKTHELDSREKLIDNNTNLVHSIARRFIGRYEYEDLVEVGKIGLIKAIDGFDESLGYSFSTYAYPLIIGEIKRFLRDEGMIKVSRQIKKNSQIISKTKEEFFKTHGKEPKISEICVLANLSYDEVFQALESSTPVMSLQEKVGDENGDMTLSDTIADVDIIDSITDRIALKQAMLSLSDFEKKLIYLRYFKNLTQDKAAQLLDISQVTVSRNEKKIIDKLRQEILGIM